MLISRQQKECVGLRLAVVNALMLSLEPLTLQPRLSPPPPPLSQPLLPDSLPQSPVGDSLLEACPSYCSTNSIV